MCILRNIIHVPSWYPLIHYDVIKKERFSALLSLCAGNHRSKWILLTKGQQRGPLMFLLSVWKKLSNKHSIGRYFETTRRSFDFTVMYWIVSIVVAGGLTPIWRQDILNRHGEIGLLHIYRHAFFSQNCPVVSATLRKWQRYAMQETSFLLFLWLRRCIVCNDCNAVYSRLVLFFAKRHRMSPVQGVTLYKPKPRCCFIKGTFVFWICIVITSVGTGSANGLVPSDNKQLFHDLNQYWRRFVTPYCVARPR